MPAADAPGLRGRVVSLPDADALEVTLDEAGWCEKCKDDWSSKDCKEKEKVSVNGQYFVLPCAARRSRSATVVSLQEKRKSCEKTSSTKLSTTSKTKLSS